MNVRDIARCSVYFIQNIRTGHVKIGFSTDVRSRLSSLQTSQVDRLALLRLVDGGPATERWLHRRFAHLSVRGEWFAFDSEMLTIVPPDEVVTPIKQTKRRDVRLTLRERIKDNLALAQDMGLSSRDVVTLLTTTLSCEEAERVIAYIEDGISADLAHERAARAGQAA
jgi:hypothetical protein